MARQLVETVASRPRNSITSINNTRKDYKLILNLHKLASAILVIIPDHLLVIVFLNFVRQSCFSVNNKTGLTYFEILDTAVLLLALMVVPFMVKMVHDELNAFQKEVLALAKPDTGDVDMALALSKALMSADMSISHVRPIRLLGLLECDSSLPIKLFSTSVALVMWAFLDLFDSKKV
ncbi:hypothetical protein HDE_11061 [Halotydeus destructor]|nr:hypothetical protein HDE_11061 [Halotydeus destructor]